MTTWEWSKPQTGQTYDPRSLVYQNGQWFADSNWFANGAEVANSTLAALPEAAFIIGEGG